MAKSVKNKLQPRRKNGYKPVSIMRDGGNVSELNYSERQSYIEEHYAPFITEAKMTFLIWDSGIEYDYKSDKKEVVSSIIEQYNKLGDYTESNLPKETVYEVKDWDLIRKDTDPETDEVIDEVTLQEVASDNTYNFSYLGLVDLNWKVFYDEEYDKYFYVIMPHLGGDIRGNYGEVIILEGNDKDELFYRFYEGFISGGASVYFKFMDGSEVSFDSEQDSDVFNFRVNEGDEPTGMALNFLEDFKEFDSWKGDEFLENTIDIYLMRKGVAPKMSLGGKLDDETPRAYIQILPDLEGKWIDLTDFSDGSDVTEHISNWMSELNEKSGGNREEYLVADYEGFGKDMYDEYMGENDFDEIIEAYSKYTNSDFPVDVIIEYKNNMGSGNRTLSDVIEDMDNNYFGKYDDYSSFAIEMVEQGVYTPSNSDVYITDTDKRILAGEESDSQAEDMAFSDLLDLAEDTNSRFNTEKQELEDEISNIESDIESLEELQESTDEQDEYDNISSEIEEKKLELESVKEKLDDIEDRYESIAKNEAISVLYDSIYDRLENDLSSWLDEYGYTDDLTEVSFLSIDYDSIGKDLANDYLVVEYEGEMYFFNNYSKGGRIRASKSKTKYDFYVIENSTKKIVSGYNTKAEAVEQRKLLITKYPSMRFEIYPLAKLESITDLDVNAKNDYVELSALDKLKKVSVDAYRYGKDKVNQAQVFLEKNDVKGKIKRGARKVADKTKQGADWLRSQWTEADFGDGTGRAKFFADGGNIPIYNLIKIENDPMAYWVEYEGEIIGNVAGIGRLGDWSWSLKTDKVDTTSTYGVFNTKEDASEKVLKEYLIKSKKIADGDGVEDKYAKGGNVSSIEKKVKEINNLIELANTNNITVVDTSGTWQSPMKYKPIKYSNGVLYIEYDELDLYSQNKKGTSDWKTVKEKVLKRDMEFDNPLNNIAKMYRKALKEEGVQFKEGGDVSDELNYINRRIKNLEDLLPQMNEDEKDEIEQTIKGLKSEKEKIQKKGGTQDLKPKKSFWLFKKGGDTGNIKYDIIPSSDSFIIAEVRKYEDSEEKNTIKDLKGQDLLFKDIKSAQNFIDNKIDKFPYGIPKANAGMMLLASQLLQPQQSQPQVVYYVPQTQEQSPDTGIIQNIPKMEFGGEFNQTDMNDFCISQLIALANDLQPVRYYTTDRYNSKDANYKKYKGKLVIVFKEPIRLVVLNALSEFIEKAVDCHDIFEQEVNVNGSETSSVSFYLLTNEFADVEYKKGGRVYDFPPKKIDVSKTKKITTELGDYNLAVITNDSIYFVNPKEGDDNAQTIMYNKKGELLSDNVLATNDLYDKLLEDETFEFIHPDIEAYRQEIISEN